MHKKLLQKTFKKSVKCIKIYDKTLKQSFFKIIQINLKICQKH